MELLNFVDLKNNFVVCYVNKINFISGLFNHKGRAFLYLYDIIFKKSSMKNTFILIVTFAVTLFFCGINLSAQSIDNSRKWTAAKHVLHKKYSSQFQKRPSSLSHHFGGVEKNLIETKNNIDTLNYPLPGDYLFYLSDDGGYVAGNNFFGDLTKVNYFENDQAGEITGILFEFAYAKGGDTDIDFAVWDNTGTGDSPGTIIESRNLSLSTIIDQVNNQQMTYIEFDPPIVLQTSFYAGVILPQNSGDTLALWTNTDGDLQPGIAWEQWSDGDWYPMSSMSTWGLDLSLAIYPILNREDLPLTAGFTADQTQVQVGGTVQFSDNSTGNPISWEWVFEGGLPESSTDQNPVIAYNQIGSFDVSLTVSDGQETHTKTIESFITVAESNVFIDTLNYPLAGTGSVYVTDQNGFVTGNNEYGDLAKANFYDFDQSGYITGVLLDFVYATGGSPDIEIALWNNNGGEGTPGTKLGSSFATWNTITNNIAEGQMTYVPFDPVIAINSPFYAGFMLPETTGDTLVVWSNMDGDSEANVAWEQWDDQSWNSISWAWDLDIALAIFPIYQNTMSVNVIDRNLVFQVYPNPSSKDFYLVTDKNPEYPVDLQVFDSKGRLVLKSQVDQFQSAHKLDLSEQPIGVYTMKAISGNIMGTYKLIKQ